jgi:hypothetical protein
MHAELRLRSGTEQPEEFVPRADDFRLSPQLNRQVIPLLRRRQGDGAARRNDDGIRRTGDLNEHVEHSADSEVVNQHPHQLPVLISPGIDLGLRTISGADHTDGELRLMADDERPESLSEHVDIERDGLAIQKPLKEHRVTHTETISDEGRDLPGHPGSRATDHKIDAVGDLGA